MDRDNKPAPPISEFEFALLEFVKRATTKGATAEEVAALPAVAEILLRYFSSGISDNIS